MDRERRFYRQADALLLVYIARVSGGWEAPFSGIPHRHVYTDLTLLAAQEVEALDFCTPALETVRREREARQEEALV